MAEHDDWWSRTPELQAFRDSMIAQGEQAHEEAIAGFPHRVNFGGWCDDTDANCDRMVGIEKELAHALAPDRYLAFPGTSMGKYKEDCFVVFFREPSDAMLLKLSTL